MVIPLLVSPRNQLMQQFLQRVADWAQVKPAAEGASVAVGRRRVLAPAMTVPAAVLRGLRGEHTTGEAAAPSTQRPGPVDWSRLLARVAEQGQGVGKAAGEVRAGGRGRALRGHHVEARVAKGTWAASQERPHRRRAAGARAPVPLGLKNGCEVQLQENLRQRGS